MRKRLPPARYLTILSSPLHTLAPTSRFCDADRYGQTSIGLPFQTQHHLPLSSSCLYEDPALNLYANMSSAMLKVKELTFRTLFHRCKHCTSVRTVPSKPAICQSIAIR
jgi:hypothetical protein